MKKSTPLDVKDYPTRVTLLIFALVTLISAATISFLLYYQSKPSFSSPPPQEGIFQDGDQIDTTIKPISFNKYKYRNSNQVHQTSFRNDPTDSAAIHFVNQYSDLSFFTNSTQSFAKANPEVEPTIDESSITYPNIFPNTDLRYTVEPSRLLEEFIVHDQNTALSMTEITQTLDRREIDSYKEVDGSIELYKDKQLVATVPKPVMYENADQEKRSYDLSYTITEIDRNTLEITKVIDAKGQAWLSDPDRKYPIVIDLVIDNADTSASWVSSDTTSTVVTQETTIKQEGTGSVKVATTGESNTTADLMEYSSNANAQAAYITNGAGIIATGGTVTYSGGYTIHKFTSSGNFTITSGSGNVEALVVAGGGAGTGYGGGGGGAGGVLNSTVSVSSGNYAVTVGNGGTAGCNTCQNTKGGNSVFSTLTAIGGGVTNFHASGGAGGSGAGGMYVTSSNVPLPGGAGTAGQGNNGGTGGGRYVSYIIGGGGGGKAGAGGNAVYNGSVGGAGGAGQSYSTSGSPTVYGGGGGGGGSSSGGAGGNGGGGAGGGPNTNGKAGIANTGGGGGGGGWSTGVGGAGGKGVVIIKYLSPPQLQTYNGDDFTATGGTITYSGGYTIHTFTSSGNFNVTAGGGSVETLVVAGGGGGANTGSGGGAGGYAHSTNFAVTTTNYPVTVGGGGGGGASTAAPGGKGGNSVFSTITAEGGGGGYSHGGCAGGSGGSGGGGPISTGCTAAGGMGSQGNRGGAGYLQTGWVGGSGGGGGAGGVGAAGGNWPGMGNGGVGLANSISGSSVYYAGGGGGGEVNGSYAGSGGNGGGGNANVNAAGSSGAPNRGGGGGGGSYTGTYFNGGNGGSGIVIIRYLTPTGSNHTQGSYSLKGIATTTAINKTLTRTIASPLNLAGHDTINFDIRSSRTGSNIKIGIHDTGGTTTEITPNITSAGSFQAVEWDISGISAANKDAIDKIIITIVNASAANTFYIDDMTATGRSINDTVTLTKSATDLSGQDNITYWVRSDTTGSFARFEFGESVSSEQTNAFTINSANTWEQKTWDITGISAAARNAVTKFAFKLTSDTNGAILYFDDIQTTLNNVAPNTPSLDVPTDVATNQLLLPVLKTTGTDTDSDYLRYKIQLCEDVGMSVSCQTFDQTSSQTGWSGQNAETSTAYASGTQATYTLQSELAANDTYYWRSYAIDPGGANSWSSTQGTPYSFSTTTAPTAPTAPYTEGATNPSGVADTTPEFSAVHNDGDGDSANYYQIVVDTQVGFDGVEMWDSGKQAMTTTANGVRSPDISYAGSALSWGTTYYWHIKFWDVNGAEGTYSATSSFGMNIKPTTPSLDAPTDTATNQSLLPDLQTTTTDPDSDYMRYKIELCEDVSMSVSCQTFDQTSSQTGWSGQDAQTSTAYASGTQATYTLQSVLDTSTTYYWRSYAIDPGGANAWSATQTPYSFTTTSTPTQQADCRVQESNNDTSLTIIWTDTATNEDGYEVQRSADGAAFSVLVTGLAANSISHQDSTIATSHTYRYRVAPYLTAGPTYGDWCYTNTLSISSGNFTYEGIIFK